MISVEQLTKFYGAAPALKGLSFTVAEGEIVGLVGKNGAGKSTVLKTLSCQLLPSSGQVRVEGLDVVEAPLEVRRLIGFLPEVPPLYPDMTVAAYLAFVAGLRGMAAAQVAGRVQQVMAQTGLAHMARRRLRHLSRGYQQRVGIAQAIVHNPRVLLLDEPMAGLDPFQIIQIRDLILSLRSGHTILFSSHILSEITQVCDRVVLIDGGVVRSVGSEAELQQTLAKRQRLHVELRASADQARAALSGLAGVTLERVLERGDVTHVDLVSDGDVREAVSHACFAASLGLLELRTERHGLEELFVQVLQQDAAAAQGGAA